MSISDRVITGNYGEDSNVQDGIFYTFQFVPLNPALPALQDDGMYFDEREAGLHVDAYLDELAENQVYPAGTEGIISVFDGYHLAYNETCKVPE